MRFVVGRLSVPLVALVGGIGMALGALLTFSMFVAPSPQPLLVHDVHVGAQLMQINMRLMEIQSQMLYGPLVTRASSDAAGVVAP